MVDYVYTLVLSDDNFRNFFEILHEEDDESFKVTFDLPLYVSTFDSFIFSVDSCVEDENSDDEYDNDGDDEDDEDDCDEYNRKISKSVCEFLSSGKSNELFLDSIYFDSWEDYRGLMLCFIEEETNNLIEVPDCNILSENYCLVIVDSGKKYQIERYIEDFHIHYFITFFNDEMRPSKSITFCMDNPNIVTIHDFVY